MADAGRVAGARPAMAIAACERMAAAVSPVCPGDGSRNPRGVSNTVFGRGPLAPLPLRSASDPRIEARTPALVS